MQSEGQPCQLSVGKLEHSAKICPCNEVMGGEWVLREEKEGHKSDPFDLECV